MRFIKRIADNNPHLSTAELDIIARKQVLHFDDHLVQLRKAKEELLRQQDRLSKQRDYCPIAFIQLKYSITEVNRYITDLIDLYKEELGIDITTEQQVKQSAPVN